METTAVPVAVVTGAAQGIGRKVAERLARDGELGGRAISHLTLYDVVEAAAGDPPAASTTSPARSGRAGSRSPSPAAG